MRPFPFDEKRAESRHAAGDATAFAPPARDAGAQELERLYERKVNGWTGRNFLTVILVNAAAQALHGAGVLRLLPAYLAAYGVATAVEYWVPPRPPERFVPWLLRVAGVCLNFYVGLVTMPESLRGSLPSPLAYFLPAFLVFLAFYWVPPLYPVKRNVPLWKWALFAAGFAAFWGLGVPH